MSRNSDLSWSLFKPAGRKFYSVEWRDPITNRLKRKSTGETSKKRASLVASDIVNQVKAGEYDDSAAMTWDDLKDRYSDEHLVTLRESSRRDAHATMNLVDHVIQPHLAESLNQKTVSQLWTHLRKQGRAESTIAKHKRTLNALLQWSLKHEYIRKAPHIEGRTQKGQAKGRALTGEEIDRLHDQARKDLKDRADSWLLLLRGIEHSGLRLREALNLTWDDTSRIWIDWTGKRPAIVIPAHMQKGNRESVLPMTNEFIALLGEIPEEERGQYVFNPAPERDHKLTRPRLDTVSKTIADLGRAAGIKVKNHTDQAKVKFASAHDLRRTFGKRWAPKVPAQVLQKMMRHQSIQTTLEFYADLDDRDILEAAFTDSRRSTDTFTDTTPEPASADRLAETEKAAFPQENGLS